MILDVEQITFYYKGNETPSLANVSFSVGIGESLGIIGPNGSGKTTLLRCISGILKPNFGQIKIAGRKLGTLSSKELAGTIAVVPQFSTKNLDFTVHEGVMMGRTPHISRFGKEKPKDLEVVQNAMELTNITALSTQRICTLSGGEFQRMIIARALAQEPKILLLDEPTVHLDISYQLEILELIKNLNKTNKITVIAVFHDLNLAAKYCGRLLLLHHGKPFAIGTPSTVLTAENIQKTYNVEVFTGQLPASSTVYILPSPSIRKE